jgi:uncharacterized protein YdcH (DUF465 family)
MYNFRKLFDEYNEIDTKHIVSINNDVVTDGHTRSKLLFMKIVHRYIDWGIRR